MCPMGDACNAGMLVGCVAAPNMAGAVDGCPNIVILGLLGLPNNVVNDGAVVVLDAAAAVLVTVLDDVIVG